MNYIIFCSELRNVGYKGQNITLIGAMSDEGLIASMTFSGSLNTDSFLVFIEQVLLPQLWAGAIVVMDNLSVHYATVTTNLIESVGAKVKFLPSYSPDLSPIELCWSKLKELFVLLKLEQSRLLTKLLLMQSIPLLMKMLLIGSNIVVSTLSL